MDAASDAWGEAVRTIDHELAIVGSAVDLVASGGAPRVALAGLRFAEQLLGPARRMALQAGVRIVPLWHVDDAGVDITVERIPAVEADGE